jgi:hypothetical protein
LVASAPGITTPGLVYELMPKLWVYLPTTEDIPTGIIWTLRAPDVPIIEAYLHARTVYFQAITAHPIDVSSPDWQRWYTDGGALRRSVEKAANSGWSGSLDSGVVLRPEVIGDGRDGSHAIVYDCISDGSIFLLSSGALAPGSSRGISKVPAGFQMLHTGSNWTISRIGTQADACA